MKAGDILTYHWGWEQTNVYFYRVVRATEKTAWIARLPSQESANRGDMMGTSMPVLGGQEGPVRQKRWRKCAEDLGGECIDMDHGIATHWDGTPQNWTAYA